MNVYRTVFTFIRLLLLTGVSVFFTLTSAVAQNAISIEHFKGFETWPIFAPGDIGLSNEDLTHIRVGYDMVFGPTGTTGGFLNVDKTLFHGQPAHWVQWQFLAEEERIPNGWPSLDLLILDAHSGSLLARTAPSRNPRGDWGGPYSSIEIRDGAFRRLTLSASGDGKLTSSVLDGPIFDFGALGFVLPFLDLKAGEGIRLNTYLKSLGDSVQPFPIKLVGEVLITDTSGTDYKVTAIDALAPDKSAVITFYVSKSKPFFYGWDYRKVEDGSSLFKMTYRGFIETSVER